MFVEMEHPVAGKLKVTGSHIKLSDTPAGVRTPSPALGQNNEEILGSLLSMTSEAIAALRAEGAV